jgi:hypothetical protein
VQTGERNGRRSCRPIALHSTQRFPKRGFLAHATWGHLLRRVGRAGRAGRRTNNGAPFAPVSTSAGLGRGQHRQQRLARPPPTAVLRLCTSSSQLAPAAQYSGAHSRCISSHLRDRSQDQTAGRSRVPTNALRYGVRGVGRRGQACSYRNNARCRALSATLPHLRCSLHVRLLSGATRR